MFLCLFHLFGFELVGMGEEKNHRYCRYWKFGTINSSIQHLLHREKPSKFTDVGKHRGAGSK